MKLRATISSLLAKHAELVLLVAITAVNAGNYLLNLVLGRLVGPEVFADVSVVATISLVFSFIGVGFQMTSARIAADNAAERFEMGWLLQTSKKFGLLLTFLLLVCSGFAASYLKMSSPLPLIILFAGLPFYVVMSVWRGKVQGEQGYGILALSFAVEMIARLIVTLVLGIIVLQVGSVSQMTTVVSIGLLLSYAITLVTIRQKDKPQTGRPSAARLRVLLGFIGSLGLYELAQILINHSDVILVKHYFDNAEAGVYAALALIGRVVYFGTWSIVMVMLPKVVSKASAGLSTRMELVKAVGIVGFIGLAITAFTGVAPELTVKLFFGETYLAMSPILWKYALATTLFACSNVVAYYYVSLDQFTPVVVALIFGVLQVAAISLFHSGLNTVVMCQITVMACLLAILTIYHFTRNLNLIYHEGRNRITLSTQ